MRRSSPSCCCFPPEELIRGDMAALEGGEEQRRQLFLPPGIRFLPTDEVLLRVYLANEVAGRVPPRGIHIPFRELYVPDADPWVVQWELAFSHGKSGEFYCYTRRSRRGPGARRTTGSGTWVAKGKNVAVMAKGTRELLGHKLMLKFVPLQDGGGGAAKNVDPCCNNWIMHEYRLPPSSGLQFQVLVLCKIFQRGSKKDEDWSEAWEGFVEAVSSVATDFWAS